MRWDEIPNQVTGHPPYGRTPVLWAKGGRLRISENRTVAGKYDLWDLGVDTYTGEALTGSYRTVDAAKRAARHL